MGRLLPGVAVLAWSFSQLVVTWTAGRVALLRAAMAGGVLLFFGVIVLQATAAFWSTETLEIFNSLTNGVVQTGQCPLAVYSRWMRRFFTFVIPMAAVSYFPGIAIIGRVDPLGSPRLFQYLAPLVGIAFFGICLQVWRIGVQHYTSTGS